MASYYSQKKEQELKVNRLSQQVEQLHEELKQAK